MLRRIWLKFGEFLTIVTCLTTVAIVGCIVVGVVYVMWHGH